MTGNKPDAVIFAARTTDGVYRDLLAAGGMSLLARQIRILKRLGVARIAIVAGTGSAPVAAELKRIEGGDKVQLVEWATDLVPESGDVLLIEGGAVIDSRIVAAVLGASTEVTDGYSPRADLVGLFPTAGGEIEAGGLRGHFAGVARVAARHLKETGVRLDELLARVVAGPAVRGVDVTALDLYCADRRRDVPLLHVPVMDARDAARAGSELVREAESAGRPWPGRLILPVFERAIALSAARAGSAPSILRLTHLIAAAGGVAAFFLGYLWIGLALAISSCLLNGGATLLARLRMLATRLDWLAAETASVVAPFWFVGLGYAMTPALGRASLGLGIGIAVFALAENWQRRFHKRLTGVALEDSGPFARKYALFAARRDSLVFTLLIFAPSGRWAAGLCILTGYAAASFLIAQLSAFNSIARHQGLDRQGVSAREAEG